MSTSRSRTKQPATPKSKSPEQVIAELLARIEKLEKSNVQEEEELVEETEEEYVEKVFNSSDYIQVMSLLPYTLNLSTTTPGQSGGKPPKKFNRFGQIKKIMYKDLIDIIDVHPNFVEGGYFYIMNPEFVRQNGLDELYTKILTKDKMEHILNTDSDSCIDLYNGSNPKQQEIIIAMLVKKMNDSPNVVNLNIIDKLSRASGINIAQIAADRIPIKDEEEEEESKK